MQRGFSATAELPVILLSGWICLRGVLDYAGSQSGFERT